MSKPVNRTEARGSHLYHPLSTPLPAESPTTRHQHRKGLLHAPYVTPSFSLSTFPQWRHGGRGRSRRGMRGRRRLGRSRVQCLTFRTNPTLRRAVVLFPGGIDFVGEVNWAREPGRLSLLGLLCHAISLWPLR